MSPKAFYDMMVRGKEMVAMFLFDDDYSAVSTKRLLQGITPYRDQANAFQYFRFVKFTLGILYRRLRTVRQFRVAEYIYLEFLPISDEKSLTASLRRDRSQGMDRVREGERKWEQ